MTEAVAFDVDGTLIDSMGLHMRAWAEAFKLYGHEATERELQTQFGRRADFFVRHFVPEADQREVDDIVTHKRELYRGRMGEIGLFPGVYELFSALREMGLKVGIATSASRPELTYYIERFNLEGRIDAAVSGDDITRSKPAPEILEKIFERLGVVPGKGVYIGDSPHDMGAARAAGSVGVGVLTGGYTEDILRGNGAIEVFDNISEIPPSLLKRL